MDEIGKLWFWRGGEGLLTSQMIDVLYSARAERKAAASKKQLGQMLCVSLIYRVMLIVHSLIHHRRHSHHYSSPGPFFFPPVGQVLLTLTVRVNFTDHHLKVVLSLNLVLHPTRPECTVCTPRLSGTTIAITIVISLARACLLPFPASEDACIEGAHARHAGTHDADVDLDS